MTGIASLFFSFFLIGLARGTAICAMVCGAGIIPYIVLKKKTPVQALRLSFLFSLPRILLLTLLGLAIGFLSYGLRSVSFLTRHLSTVQNVVYLIFGSFLLLLGFYLQACSIEERENKKELKSLPGGSNKTKCCTPVKKNIFTSILDEKISVSGKGERMTILTMGALLGLGCMSEVALVEGTLLAGGVSFLGGGLVASLVYGGLSMALFALGLSGPLIVISMLSARLSSHVGAGRGLNIFKSISSVVMMLMGVIIISSVLLY